jgi:hypothetical protein
LVTKTNVDYCEFNSVLLEAIDKTLSVCGEETKSMFFKYLEKALNIPKNKIPGKIDEFSKALEDLFGPSSRYLEILVIKNLHSRAGVVWEWKPSNPWVAADFTFKEYVSVVKKYFEDAKRYEEQMSFFVYEKEALEIYK